MHRHFEEMVQELNDRLLVMSGRAEGIIRKAVEALLRRDGALADEVFADDRVIDGMEIEIEERCIELLATQQPLARDLRLITSAIKISNDLERVGDHAVNIAGSAKTLLGLPPVRVDGNLPTLADKAVAMLRASLDAFVLRDAEAARALVLLDDEVDALNREHFAAQLAHMVARPSDVQACMALVLVGRNLERIGDLATNVAEEVVFIAQARVIKHHAEERAALEG